MSNATRGWGRLGWVALTTALVACGDDAAPTVRLPDAGNDAQVTVCDSHNDCDDGAYCNGAESCDPTHANADEVTGCVAGAPIVCDDDVSCTLDRCDESTDACDSVAPDADNDGHDDASCLDANGDALGDDCDDDDANRFPGNTETCDPASNDASHDEDCNPSSIGRRDLDQDTHVDAACSNMSDSGVVVRGDDCDDDEDSVYAGAQEICDGIDNDCDSARAIDNGLFCGACMCSVPNAAPNCTAGPTECTVGVCDTGFLNCDTDQDNGCEARRDHDASCGECGNVCTEHASCAATGSGTFACECDEGFTGDGVTCDACPAGYVGDGAGGCAPVLTDLTLSVGTLSPALNDATRNYAVRVGPGVGSITFHATVVTGASVAFNTETVASGAAWQSPTLSLGTNTVTIDVSEGGHMTSHYVITITRGSNIDYLKASNTDVQDELGVSVAIDGNTLVIGADGESSNATTVNGNQANNSVDYAGAAYVFVRNGNAWVQEAYLKASNTNAGDLFGTAVAISGDTIVVAAKSERSANPASQADNTASNAGAVYVFVRSNGTWTQQAYLKAGDPDAADYFGESVAIAGDTIVVGADGESSGVTVINGDESDNSAADAGAAYVFVRANSVWTQQAYLKASNAEAGDAFGRAVAISGDTIAVGAPGEASAAGAAYVFVRANASWMQQAYLKASNAGADDGFGEELAIDADTIVVGAIGEDGDTSTGVADVDDLGDANGAAYVFARSGGSWSQQAYLKPTYPVVFDFFGSSVAVEGDAIVVGAAGAAGTSPGFDGDQTDASAPYSGAAYVFSRRGVSWTQITYLKATNPEYEDNFGYCAAIDSGTIVVGAPFEDGGATGINGEDNNDSFDSGAVYVFR